MFRVAAGQFEAAQGWVRCGYCGDVFDAAQHLVPADAALPGEGGAVPVVPAVPVLAAVSVPPEEALEVLPALAGPTEADVPDALAPSSSQPGDAAPALPPNPPDSVPVAPEPAPQEQEPALPVSSVMQAAEAPADVQTEAVAEAAAANVTDTSPDIGAFPPVAALTPSVDAPADVAAEPVADAAAETNPVITPLALLEPAQPASEPAPAPEPAPELSFVRDARRKAFWQRPLVRVLLGLVFLLLLTALLLQWVLQQKDNLAATDPRLAPFLQALCGPLDCTIRPPRRIESLLIDSSSFRKTGPDVYSLSFVLKNNSAAVLEMPSLEVTLTDVQEQALVRRVLAPREFGATTAALAAHGELAGVITLKVAAEPVPGAPLPQPLPVTGYRVVAFYP